MSTIIYNGNFIASTLACFKSNDRGFSLGHGLFETILVKNGAIPLLEYHWKRLESSASLIGIAIPFLRQEFEVMIIRLIEHNQLQYKIAGARVTVTHGDADRGILPLQTPHPNFIISVFEHSHVINNEYSALIVTTRKNEHALTSRIKSISYLDNIMAKQEALKEGYHEAILLNTSLSVADGAISNVFMVKNQKVMTPKITDGALPGVIRTFLLEEFKRDYSIVEKSISASELLDADEVFLTNALMGIQPVKRLNERKLDSFAIAHQIGKALRERKNYI